MKIIRIGMIGIMLVMSAIAIGQTSQQQPVVPGKQYQVPFASSGNRIELTVANGSSSNISEVEVEGMDLPKWLHLSPEKQRIKNIAANGETQVEFTFSIDKTAPVNKDQSITFNISTVNGEHWAKQINLSVTVPERFELYQNYPNPFNPTTVIGYQLSTNSFVTLRVYSVLGQEIETLISAEQPAGYHEAQWNAGSVSNGIYFYRMQSQNFSAIKKMMVVK